MKGHNINHKYKTIFIHVPKNGGVSIKDSLQTTWEGGEHHRDINQVRRICIESYGSEAGIELFSTYFKFGFVRNPWGKRSVPEAERGLWVCRSGLQGDGVGLG